MYPKAVRPMILLLSLMLVVSACTPATQAPPPATAVVTAVSPATAVTAPTTAPTTAPSPAPATPAATLPPATSQPTPVASASPAAVQGKTAQFQGVTFTYDASVGTGVTATLVPTATEPLPAFGIAPQHVEFMFAGYPAKIYGPQIYVFPLDAYLAGPDIAEIIRTQADALRADLAQRPDLNAKYLLFKGMDQNMQLGDFPPLVPPVNAQVSVAAKKGYVNFANGSGLRFVYWASQAPQYVDPTFLFYTYEGLTSDGKHFVSMTFPVYAPVDMPLPTIGPNVTLAELNAFNQTMAQQIEAADPAAFIPPLPALDALAQSLQIGPEAP